MLPDCKTVVYIIDDDISVRRGLERLIAAHGFDARSFPSAHAFLAAGLPGGNSCIVLDVAMPGMDGLELQAELVALGCKAPIIFITALPDPQFRNRARRAGAVGFFQKPIDGATLVGAIQQAMGKKQGGENV